MINLVKTVLAADTVVDIETRATQGNFFGYTCIGHLVSNLVADGFIVGGVITFLYLVWGGMDYLMAGGDKGKIESGQKRISSAIIGLAIIASYLKSAAACCAGLRQLFGTESRVLL